MEYALRGNNAYDKASYCTEIALAVQETYDLSDGEYVEFTILDHHYVMTNQRLLHIVEEPEDVVQIPQITPAEISKILLLQKYDTPLYTKNNDRSLEITNSVQVARWQDEAVYTKVNSFRSKSRITPPALPPKLLLDYQKPENSDVLSHLLKSNGFHVSCNSDGTPILTLCYEVEEQSGIILTEKFKLSDIKYEDNGLSTKLLGYKSPRDPSSDYSFRIQKTPRGYWLKQNKVVHKIEQSELDERYYQSPPQYVYKSHNGETPC